MHGFKLIKIVKTVKIAALSVLSVLAVTISGCHGLPEKIDETAVWPVDKLYTEAQDSLAARDWSRCARYFEIFEGRDPFGPRAQQAQINLAYCHWKNNEAAVAEQSVDYFIQRYPDHTDIAYAYYLKGLIHFNDDLGLFGQLSQQDMSERDSQTLRDAYQAFKIVVDRYPKSPYALDAAQRMRYIVNALASHEVHVARYYYRRGAYIAAINRVQEALKQYPNTSATEEALRLMLVCYEALGETQLAEDTARVLSATVRR